MDLIVEILKLKEHLKNEEIIKNVHIQENIMLNDENTQLLVMRYQNAITSYNDAIRYNLSLDKYQKELSASKEALYSSQLVKNYLQALKNANEFLNKMKHELFIDIKDLESKNKICSLLEE